MALKLRFSGTPLSTQTCYRYTCRGSFPSLYMKDECKQKKSYYKNASYTDMKAQGIKRYEGNIIMIVNLHFGDKRKRDVDNFLKLLLDGLEGVCYNNDAQIVELTVTKAYDKKNPRVEVYIEEE